MKKILSFFKSHYCTIDIRALVVFRIGLGLLCCLNTIRLFPYIELYFSNNGIFSNHFALFQNGIHKFSLLYAFSTVPEVTLFFSLTFLLGTLFTLGIGGKPVHFMLLICMMSIINRNFMLVYGADTVMLLFLFYSLFLPLHDRWSNSSIQNPMVALILFQLAAIYLYAAVSKDGKTWQEGSAFYYVLHQDRIVTALGYWLRESLSANQLWFASKSSQLIEIIGGILILSPFKTFQARRLGALLLIFFHILILLTVNLGLFPYIMIIILSMFLWIPDFSHNQIQTAELIPQRTKFLHTTAVSFLFIIFSWLCLANNRVTAWILPAQLKPFHWIKDLEQYTSFDQYWSMFAPDAPEVDIYLVIEAVLPDGRSIDAFTGKPLMKPLQALQYKQFEWDQPRDAFTRLFSLRGVNDIEITRWLKDRRGGLAIPKDQTVSLFKCWEIIDTTPPLSDRTSKPKSKAFLRLEVAGG